MVLGIKPRASGLHVLCLSLGPPQPQQLSITYPVQDLQLGLDNTGKAQLATLCPVVVPVFKEGVCVWHCFVFLLTEESPG